MKKIIKNKGIVIHTIDYKENASLATIMTEEGMGTYLIKGAKKINSGTKKFASVLTEISFNAAHSNSISTFTEGVVLNNFTFIKDDLDKFNHASVILEKLYFFKEQITDYKTLYNFIIKLFSLFEVNNSYDSLILIFDTKLLYLLGVAPSFNRCPLCGKKAVDGAFDIKNGGFICKTCQYQRTPALNVLSSSLFKKIYTTKIDDITPEFLDEIALHKEISNAVDRYYEYHLDFSSKAKKILIKIGE